MNRTIGVMDFQSTINQMLDEYGDDVREALIEAIDETANESVKDLKNSGDFNGKKYRSSWTSQSNDSRVGYGRTVFNSKHYRLTHLLEFGHVKQNGGRTRAFPHIAPVNDEAQSRVIDKLERKLER